MPIDPIDPNDAKLKEQLIESIGLDLRQAKVEEKLTSRLESKGSRQLRDAKATKLWDEHRTKSNDLVKRGQTGFDSWISAMCSLWELCIALNEAIHASNPIGSIGERMGDLGNCISDLISAKYPGKLPTPEQVGELPRLLTTVGFTEDDKLKINPLSSVTRADGKLLFDPKSPNAATQQQVLALLQPRFETGILGWLRYNGYQAVPAQPGVFLNVNTGLPLTKDDFEALKDDPVRGLNEFLHKKFDLDFEVSPPSATPTI